jgi:hypothetical protein
MGLEKYGLEGVDRLDDERTRAADHNLTSMRVKASIQSDEGD